MRGIFVEICYSILTALDCITLYVYIQFEFKFQSVLLFMFLVSRNLNLFLNTDLIKWLFELVVFLQNSSLLVVWKKNGKNLFNVFRILVCKNTGREIVKSMQFILFITDILIEFLE